MPKIPPEIQQKYGKILFADHERFKQKGTGKEKNTFIENDKFANALDFVTTNFGDKITKDIIKTFEALLKSKKYYPEVLDPGNPKEVLRGFTLTHKLNKQKYDETLKVAKTLKYANRLVNQRKFDGIKYVILPKQMTYKPRTYAESWTVSEQIASGFSAMGYNRKANPPSASVIISCKPPKNELLFNPEFTNTLSYKEFEVIRLSNKPIKCTAYIAQKDWNSFVTGIPPFF